MRGAGVQRLARMHVHAALLQRDGDALVSRDQARVLLNRVETCREALIDFRGVETIGPAFADEVFRVFRTQFPDTTIVTLNAGPGVRTRISRNPRCGAHTCIVVTARSTV